MLLFYLIFVVAHISFFHLVSEGIIRASQRPKEDLKGGESKTKVGDKVKGGIKLKLYSTIIYFPVYLIWPF